MKKVYNIVVEGLKDAYFLHQLFLEKFNAEFFPMYRNGTGLEYVNTEKFVFYGKKENDDIECDIIVNGGYNVEGSLKTALMDKVKNGQLAKTLIVFDADLTGETDDSGNEKRRHFIMNQVEGILGQLRNDGIPFAPEYSIFLFPDNKNDGDLETLLLMISKNVHKYFFFICWPVFQWLLRVCKYLKLSNKTLIYDYVEAMYLHTNKVARVKDKQGYNKNMKAKGLWDWSHVGLNPIVKFLSANIC